MQRRQQAEVLRESIKGVVMDMLKNVVSAINIHIQLEFPKQHPKDVQNVSEREMNQGSLGNKS